MRPINKIIWKPEMVKFLKENFYSMTNKQLADALSLKLTVTRNKARELGLCRIEVDPWTSEQTQYLIANYQRMGDVEIAENLQIIYPRKRMWNKKHIRKKRNLLGLNRTIEQVAVIKQAHVIPGGRCYTILQNSSSKNLPDIYVANLIAWRDAELRDEILKYPELISVKRQEILLNRSIKGSQDGKKGSLDTGNV